MTQDNRNAGKFKVGTRHVLSKWVGYAAKGKDKPRVPTNVEVIGVRDCDTVVQVREVATGVEYSALIGDLRPIRTDPAPPLRLTGRQAFLLAL